MIAKSNVIGFIQILKIIAMPEPISVTPTKYVQNTRSPIHFGTIVDTKSVNTK